MSKKWLDGLPADLQKVVRNDAESVSKELVPFVKEFYAKQRQLWTEHGGELTSLPEADKAALIAKISSIGFDLSKSRPDLNKAVATVFESANHNK